jgi:phospholipid transport system substrate-binding protein
MTTRRRTILFTLLLLLVSSFAFAGKSKDAPGTRAVKAANAKIAKLLKKKAASTDVTKAVSDFIDIDELGKQAMVNHWSSLTSAQQTTYLDTLRKLIQANYVKGMNANLKYKTVYTGETVDANGVRTVTTKVKTTRNGHPYTVKIDYALKADASGKTWKAYDVITDDVGLVENYKAMFDKIIDKDGFDKLIEKMQKKQAEIEASANASATSTTTTSTASNTQ